MPAQQYYQPVPATSGMAIASLVLSLCFFIPFVNFVHWLLALIFGHIALVQIKRNPAIGGRGLALAGVIISYVWLLFAFAFALYLVSQRASY
jgi:hypothetical protein